MRHSLQRILLEMDRHERKASTESSGPINEAYAMIEYLQTVLTEVKLCIQNDEFRNASDEIFFFRNVKPQILGKLMYYNKVARIESGCPVYEGTLYVKYFSAKLKELKQKFSEYICNSDFYRYYRSGRTDLDHIYFRLGNINYHDGLSSFVFEIDPNFSTYYDNKVAQIIASEALYQYLLEKFSLEQNPETFIKQGDLKDVFWTGTKSALIELIYALFASGLISNGEITIKKLSIVFQVLFQVDLNDIHHAFHRMKVRAGSRTAFLDQLKSALEQYMEESL